MPTICRVAGVLIRMYFDDHPPPHFHAMYGQHEAKYLLDGTRTHGCIPPAKDRAVRTLALRHGPELEECWNRASRSEAPGTIETDL